MATLREIRRRINSIRSTQQITKAMKMVAAAKLRRAQENIFAARPYAYKIQELISHLLAKIENPESPLLQVRPVKRMYLVVVTADRGLCGAFNTNIIRKTLFEIDLYRDREIALVCIGKKGFDFFNKRNYNIVKSYINLFNDLRFENAREIVDVVTRDFIAGKTDEVKIIYNEFKSAVQQNLIVEDFLPIKVERESDSARRNQIDYLYEPSRQALLSALLPKHLNIHMWRVLLESFAAEQGARMTAMENATDNAGELIHDLTLHYNRARQAAITKEISEIVGGAEALKSAS